MNVKHYVRALLCLYFSLLISIQSVQAQSLKVGDSLPPELWNMPLQVINHPQGIETITLSEYKDKLIILDFWATWCAPCIKSLTKLDTLQQEFGEQLAVIPITYENADKVLPFLTNRGYQLRSVINDSTLKKYFPHRSIPHQVWVRDGNVLAVTGAEYTTRENISKTLKREKVQMLMKEEDMEFDKDAPLSLKDGGGLIYQSVFSKRINARIAGNKLERNRVLLYNVPIHNLLRFAYVEDILWADSYNRVISFLSDSLNDRVFPPHFGTRLRPVSTSPNEWSAENTYCYNLELHKELSYREIRSLLKTEINRIVGTYMGIQAGIENIQVKCMALVVIDSAKVKTASSDTKVINRREAEVLKLQNVPFDTFAFMLREENMYQPVPILNKVKEKVNISLTFTGPLTNLSLVKKDLNTVGYDLIETEEIIPMLVYRPLNDKEL